MNSRSAATMELTLAFLASAMRSPLPSGSRRAALVKPLLPGTSLSSDITTGRWNATMMMLPAVRTCDSTSSDSVRTMRTKPFSKTALASPRTGWAGAWATAR